jgi:hypothetical protein
MRARYEFEAVRGEMEFVRREAEGM